MDSESRQVNFFNLVIWIALLLGGINLIILDIWIFKNYQKTPEAKGTSVSVEKKSEPEVSSKIQSFSESPFCPNSCLVAIEEATRSLKLKETKIAGRPLPSNVKEFFVPLGSGTNTSSNWTDVPGAQASVDSKSYAKVKEVIFEASITITHGNQTTYIRLFNVTDNNVVWNTEMTHEGSETKLLVSPPLTLPSGSKLYQVQMKSQLGGPTVLNQSKLHITVH